MSDCAPDPVSVHPWLKGYSIFAGVTSRDTRPYDGWSHVRFSSAHPEPLIPRKPNPPAVLSGFVKNFLIESHSYMIKKPLLLDRLDRNALAASSLFSVGSHEGPLLGRRALPTS